MQNIPIELIAKLQNNTQNSNLFQIDETLPLIPMIKQQRISRGMENNKKQMTNDGNLTVVPIKDQSRRNAKRSFLVNIKPKFVEYDKKSNYKARKEKIKQQDDKNKIESKQIIDRLELLNKDLQSKINYFYQPYKCPQMKNYLIPMNFEEECKEEISGCKTPQNEHKWRKVSNFLLKKETMYLREYLKYVNPEMYNQLKQLGCEIIESNHNQKCEDKDEPRSLSPSNFIKNKKEFQQNISKLMARRILGNEGEHKKKLNVLSCDVGDESNQVDDSIVSPLLSIMRTKNTLKSECNSPNPKPKSSRNELFK